MKYEIGAERMKVESQSNCDATSDMAGAEYHLPEIMVVQ
jgi:hypothetical protein